MLYFDHNASSPLCTAAREAWLNATARFIGNPSSPHRLGSRADAALSAARERLAELLGCAAAEIAFTSGATESNNTIVAHLAAVHPGGEAWVSAIEHPCVRESVRRGFPGRIRSIGVDGEGRVDAAWVAAELAKARPAFVGIMAANNETGVLQPWREVREVCASHGVPFFCDAAQWIGKLPLKALGQCDFLSGCAHKFGGPQGVGFLKAPVDLRPLLVGGPQEDGRRAGTENVAGILSMVAALESRSATVTEAFLAERLGFRDGFEAALVAALPGVQVVGAGAERLWNTVSVVMPEIDCRQRWVVKLDKLGVAASTGSACASGKEQTSHVLAAMGMPPGAASRVLRFSAGWETSAADWSRLLEVILAAARELGCA